MMTGDQQLVEVEDYETTNIQLGIFIPSQTPLRKKAKKLKTALQPETNGAEEGDGETSGRRRRKKRNRLDSEDSSTDSTPTARPTETDVDSRPTEIDVDSRPTGTDVDSRPTGTDVDSRPTGTDVDSRPTGTDVDTRPTGTDVDSRPTGTDVDSRPTEIDVDSEQIPNNKKRKKKKRKKKKHTSEALEEDRESGVSDRDRALEYLRRWDRGSDGWSFRKKTQYWLLQNAYDKTKVSASTLTHLCEQKKQRAIMDASFLRCQRQSSRCC